jgi:hypothetical protein
MTREIVEAACRGVVWYDHGVDGPSLGDSRIELCCTLKNGEMKIIHAASLDIAYDTATEWINNKARALRK